MSHQAYFFDFDHTLFDSDASESLAFDHALNQCGIAPTPDHFTTYKTINAALWRLVEAGGISPNDVKTRRFSEFVEATALDLNPVALANSFTGGMQEFGELYPGAADIVASLAERGPVAMVTNAISEIQRRRIERVGVDPLFDAIVISTEVGVAKPDPAIFDHAFAALGPIKRSETLMIGDSLSSDIAGGHAAGLITCWYNPHHNERRTAPVPDHEISSLSQLLEL